MKRAVLSILAIVLALCLCGCSFSVKDILDNSTSGKIISDALGILIGENLSGEQVKKIKRADVNPDGITTLCYETLSEKQKLIYEYILTATKDMPEGWICCGKSSGDYQADVSKAYKAVLNDNPQIFWMPISYAFGLSDDNLCVAFKIDEDDDVKCDYIIQKEERDIYSQKLNEQLDSVVASANAYGTDFEKELFVHDYICGITKYNLDGGKMIYSSYGALVDNVAVCEGYSRAMQLCMQKLNIKCGLVYGKGNDNNHMWNYINIGGEWYHTDLTWDCSEEHGVLHSFFNIDDAEAVKTHIISEMLSEDNVDSKDISYNVLNYPCVSNNYNYYKYFNLCLTNDVKANASIVSASFSGKDFCEYKNEMTGNVKDILNATARKLYPRIKLKSYSITDNFILIFFERM